MVTMYLKDKNNGCLSEKVSIYDVIFDQYEIEFRFPNYIDEYGDIMEVGTLPYKNFLFFQNDYEVIVEDDTSVVMEVDEEHIKQQLDYFKNRDLVCVNGGRGYGKTQYEKLQHNWDELKKWLEEQKDYLTEIDGQHIPLNDSFKFCSMNELYQTGKYSGLKDTLGKMQEIEEKNNE